MCAGWGCLQHLAISTGSSCSEVALVCVCVCVCVCVLAVAACRSIIELARLRGYTVLEEPISIQEAMEADEVFTTGTAVVGG